MAEQGSWAWLEAALLEQGWTAYGDPHTVTNLGPDQHSGHYTESPWIAEVNAAKQQFGHREVGMFGLYICETTQKKLFVRTEALAAENDSVLARAS